MNCADILKSTNEIEEIILGSYNTNQPIGFAEVIRCRELLRRIEKEVANNADRKRR